MNIDTSKPINNGIEFMQGQKACEAGSPCPDSVSEDFVRGYNVQYQLEQIQTQKSLKLENHCK